MAMRPSYYGRSTITATSTVPTQDMKAVCATPGNSAQCTQVHPHAAVTQHMQQMHMRSSAQGTQVHPLRSRNTCSTCIYAAVPSARRYTPTRAATQHMQHMHMRSSAQGTQAHPRRVLSSRKQPAAPRGSHQVVVPGKEAVAEVRMHVLVAWVAKARAELLARLPRRRVLMVEDRRRPRRLQQRLLRVQAVEQRVGLLVEREDERVPLGHHLAATVLRDKPSQHLVVREYRLLQPGAITGPMPESWGAQMWVRSGTSRRPGLQVGLCASAAGHACGVVCEL